MRARAQRLSILALVAAMLLIVLVAVRVDADPFADPAAGTPDQTVLFPEAMPPAPDLASPAAASIPGPGYLSPVTAAPRPFTNALVRWEAAVPVSATVQLELRVSLDGQAWSEWAAVEEDADLWVPEDGPELFWGQDLYAGEGAQFWQVRATLTPAPDGAAPMLRKIEVNTVDARFGPPEPAPDLLSPQIATVGRPAVVSRSAWGSPDGQGSRAAPAYRNVRHMVVHHTADSNALASGQRWSDRVRAIWSFHTVTRGWGDIGYNYLIDPNGVIYEGRAGGDDAVGFHDTANYGSLGVSMIGTYTSAAPSSAAQNSLVELLAWKAGQKDIDPFGRAFYYGCSISNSCAPFNPGAIVSTISGHRDVTPGRTTCPGDSLEALLPSIRQRVRDRLGSTPPPPPEVQLELLGLSFDRTSVPAGELLKATFTLRNSGKVAVEGQAPEAPRDPTSGAVNLAESYVYDESECFLGAEGQSYPSFPKEPDRIRLMLGPVDEARQPVCAGGSGGYPWRWGINGRLEPGEVREVVAYLRLRTPGTLTLQAGLINEYVGYMAQGVASTTITVTPERQMPAPAAFDERLQPLAHLYELGTPGNLASRTSDPTALLRGAYLRSFPWQGEALDLGGDGSLPRSFLLEQTRVFVAPVGGSYGFRLDAGDNAWLWVNGQLVASGAGAEGTIELAPGRHVLAFKALERDGTARFGYWTRLPGQAGFGALPEGVSEPGHLRLGASFRSFGGLSVVAADMGGAGVASIRTSLNDAAWTETTGSIVSLGALPDGSYTLRYLAVDAVGNQSEERSISFRVDATMTVYRSYMPLLAGAAP